MGSISQPQFMFQPDVKFPFLSGHDGIPQQSSNFFGISQSPVTMQAPHWNNINTSSSPQQFGEDYGRVDGLIVGADNAIHQPPTTVGQSPRYVNRDILDLVLLSILTTVAVLQTDH